jgi:hypothetical protein
MKWEVYKDKAGEYRWRLVAANGEIVAASEGYKNKKDAIETINIIKEFARKADVEEVEK